MRRIVSIFIAALALSVPLMAGSETLRFVSCPMMRNTADVPCWLAEYQGRGYYLTKSQDLGAEIYPPQLMHQVLVEGEPDPSAPTVCGGIAFKSIRLSVLPEVDARCQTILPADGMHIEAVRMPGPNSDAGRGKGYVQPKAELEGESTPQGRQFIVPFGFDSAFLTGRPYRIAQAAATFARERPGSRVQIAGYRFTMRLSNGRVMAERASLGERRADELAQIISDVGQLDPSRVSSHAVEAAQSVGELHGPGPGWAVIVVRDPAVVQTPAADSGGS